MSDPRQRRSLVWSRPDSLTFAEELKGFGGVASPLLAGFSLATIATVLSADKPPHLSDYAVIAFAFAATFHIFALQFSYVVVRYSASPEERLNWHPEASVDREALETERKRQYRDMKLAKMYSDRAGLFYNLGLLAVLSGLCLLVFPRDWSVASGIGFGVAASALLVELLWISTQKGFGIENIRPLMPRRKDVKDDPDVVPPPLDEISLAAAISAAIDGSGRARIPDIAPDRLADTHDRPERRVREP